MSNMNFDDERNFNKQEIEDFFGIDYKEMQKIVNDNKTEINNDKVISKRSSLVTPQAKDELKQNLQETFGQYVSQQELLNKQLPTNIFKIGQNQNDTLQLEDINMQGLDESLRLEELKMEQHELNQMHGKLVDNQFSRFELLMSKFSQKDNTNKNSTDNQRSQEISEFKSDSIQKQSNTTSSSRQTTAAKSPFNVRKEPSASSISTLPLSMAPSSIRGSAMSRSNTSSNHRKIMINLLIIILFYDFIQLSLQIENFRHHIQRGNYLRHRIHFGMSIDLFSSTIQRHLDG